MGRQRRTSRPLQRSKSRACHAETQSAGGTPAAYITPLAEQKVARLPRKRRGAQVGRQQRTSRPLQSRKPRACHAETHSPGGTPAAYITPLAEQKVARLPRKRRGAQVGRQRRTSRPLQSRKPRACHAKSAKPRWDASGVHHAPCRAESRAPATQKARSPGGTPAAYITPLAEHKASRLPRKRRGAQVGRQRRTSRPLQRSKSRACHARDAEPRWDASGVHHAPCRAETRAPATQKARSLGGTPPAYITPLAEQKVARLPRKKRGAQVGRQRRTSRPLQRSKSRACHAKGAEPRWDASGVHHAPCRATKSRACHAKGAEPRWDASGVHHAPCRGASRAPATQRRIAQVGRQRRTSRPLQSRKSRACHAKGAEPRWDASGVHHAPCRAESRAAQVGRQRRTSRPLQRSKSRACHAKGAEPRWDASGVHHAPCRGASQAPATQKARSPGGTPAAYITPLAEQKVARLPRKRRGCV